MQRLSIDDHRDPTRTLTTLHFTYEEWDWENTCKPQFYDYCRWIKKSILRGHPVMFAAYLLYLNDDDYDHIMPAVGIRFRCRNVYDPDDVLIYYNFFDEKQIERKMNKNDLAATRKTCQRHCGEGGCLPFDVRKLFITS